MTGKSPKSNSLQSERRVRRKLPLGRKLIYSLIPTACMLIILEIVLGAIGIKPEIDRADPYEGFSKTVRLWEERDGRLETSPPKLTWFNRQVFEKQKPRNTKRIFCVGGSTTYGRPYADSTSYSGWLRQFLPLVDDSVDWQVINAGGVSYASYRVSNVVEELAQYEPDLFIVYTAHNEFLEQRTYRGLAIQPTAWLDLQAMLSRTRVFTVGKQLTAGWRRDMSGWETSSTPDPSFAALPLEVDERLNHTIGPVDYVRDPQWTAHVLDHYEHNLRRIVRVARDAGAQVVLVTPASNLKDCSPFKSEKLNSNNRAPIAEVPTATQNLATNADEKTARELQRIVALNPRNADALYRYGRRLFAEGTYDEAEHNFQCAVDEDICPLRATSSIVSIIHRVAEELAVPLVDFGHLLAEKSQQDLGHRCVGDEYFLDHVHPTIEVHQLLSHWILNRLQTMKFVGGLDVHRREMLLRFQAAYDREVAGLDQRQHGVALRNLAKVFHWSGKFEESSRRASDALDWLPEDAESRLILADSLKNLSKGDEAAEQYERLFEQHPNYARAFLPFGEFLSHQGEKERAMGYLLSAILHEPDNSYAHYTLGKLHQQHDEFELAIEAFETAVTLAPGNSDIQSQLEQAREAKRQADLRSVIEAEETE